MSHRWRKATAKWIPSSRVPRSIRSNWLSQGFQSILSLLHPPTSCGASTSLLQLDNHIGLGFHHFPQGTKILNFVLYESYLAILRLWCNLSYSYLQWTDINLVHVHNLRTPTLSNVFSWPLKLSPSLLPSPLALVPTPSHKHQIHLDSDNRSWRASSGC